MSRDLRTPGELADLLGIRFSEQQLAAITAELAPGVIIAGAGSGKTTVMAARVVWLVGSGAVRPDGVLGLTFTRKAAGELSLRVRSALSRAGVQDAEAADGEGLILTYDAFAGRLVSEHGLLLGIEDGWRMITGAARFRLAARVVADAPGPWQHLSRLRPDTITQRVLELSAELRSHLVDPADLAGHAAEFLAELDEAPTTPRGLMYASLQGARGAAAERLELARLVEAYENLKQRLGLVEFADQMAWAARLATDVPSVGSAVRHEFGVVLLDEYQDTSAAQAGLLRGLFSGPDAAHGRGHPVTAVGDPCQAIYTWRGAAASNILRFAGHFPAADGSPAAAFSLTINRRSGQRILDAANELAQSIRHEPGLVAAGLDLDLVCPPQTPAAHISTAEFDTWPDELAWIADRVVAEHDSGAVRLWSDIAVLTRRNAHIAGLYAELTSRGVPTEIVGLGGLLDLPAVAEVTATLRLLADPSDNPALVRLLTSPRWAIGIPDLALLGRRAVDLAGRSQRDPEASIDEALADLLAGLDPTREISLLEACQSPGDLLFSSAARERFQLFCTEFANLRRWASESVVELCLRVIDTLGIEVELATEGGDPAQLAAFVEAVAAYTDIDGEASLSGLLAYFDAERNYGLGLEQAVVTAADSVKLLTVHKAKGLEWDVVFLPALAADVFPTDRVSGNWLRNAAVVPHPLRGDADSIPQLPAVTNQGFTRFADALTIDQRLSEDRLAYVAVTRARHHLYGTGHAWAAQLSRPRGRSGYLTALIGHADTSHDQVAVSEQNPLSLDAEAFGWPALGGSAEREQRLAAVALVEAARAVLDGGLPGLDLQHVVDLDAVSQVREWQASATALLAEAEAVSRRRWQVVPEYLSVTALSRIARDWEGFTADLARPMPRLVSPEQRAGTAFHRWLERRFGAQAPLVDDLPDHADTVDQTLRDAFLTGPFADRTPLAVEVPFTMVLGGRLVRGRIDAVFDGTDGHRFLVVDWKTGHAGAADPLQLAYYRLAWAELSGVSVAAVDAVFYDVHEGSVRRPGSLPDRGQLEGIVTRLSAEA